MTMRFLLLMLLLASSISPIFSPHIGPNRIKTAVLTITSNADSGPGSLRQALLDAQDGDTIQFSTMTFPAASPTTISLLSELPQITQNQLTIDASQAGVILDGSQTSSETNGLTVRGTESLIQGLTVRTFPGNGILTQAANTHIRENTISGNGKNGILSLACSGNTFSQNSIYQNGDAGIQSDCVPAPLASAISRETVTGQSNPGARIEIFSDDEFEGQHYEGYTLTDASGVFTFTQPGGFTFSNITVTSTNADGNTSPFSLPVHTLWTLLLYLNGNNDLNEVMFNVLDNLATHEANQYTNVIALIDGSPISATETYSGTALYDLSYGQATPISTILSGTLSIPGELNMGAGQTLEAFVQWAREHYPTSYIMLSIVDHGGGWAPSIEERLTDTQIMSVLSSRHQQSFNKSGGSGVSWDTDSDYDYLDIREIQRSLAAITNNGNDPLDIIFFDVCLMGLGEVAYQFKDYAGYYVSTQNLGWAPIGPENRYIRLLESIQGTTTPSQMAAALVEAYAQATPAAGHPFTISAIDLSQMTALQTAIDQLSVALGNTLTHPSQVLTLYNVYEASQKFDYDTSLEIEPSRDAFIDLYDFALEARTQFTNPIIDAAANQLIAVLDAAIIAESHRSDSPWTSPNTTWDLDGSHGLSLFLPLGEDLILPITYTSTITPDLVITQNIHLYELYTADQLDFVRDTHWGTLISNYYEIAASAISTDTTEGPLKGLLLPDIFPPQTTITVTGIYTAGHDITIQWSASDIGSGTSGVELWYRPPGDDWAATGNSQTGSSGTFTFELPRGCITGIAVRAFDKAQNLEAYDSMGNTIYLHVDYCAHLPTVLKDNSLQSQ